MTKLNLERHLLLHDVGSKQRQVLRLPTHGSLNAISPAGVVEENPFLHRAGAHLAILAQMNRSSRETVGLTAGVQSVHVSLILVSPDMRVDKRRVHESKHRTEQQNQRQHRCVPNAANLPTLAPAGQSAFEGPAQQSKENKDDHGKIQYVLSNVMKDEVAHFMAHDGL